MYLSTSECVFGVIFCPKIVRGRISITFFHIAQNLIVSSVFFDNVKHMFKNGRFTNPFRNADGLSRFPWHFFEQSQPEKLVRLLNRFGKCFQLFLVRNRNDRNRSCLFVRVVGNIERSDGLRWNFGTLTFDISNDNRFLLVAAIAPG